MRKCALRRKFVDLATEEFLNSQDRRTSKSLPVPNRQLPRTRIWGASAELALCWSGLKTAASGRQS
jgi:hypothetical protein